MPKEWTADEIADFRGAYGTNPDDRLAARFGCTVEDVQELARRYALGKDKRHFRTKAPRWTDEDLDRLRALFPGRPTVDVARELGRTVKSVSSRAALLGLRKDPRRLEEMGKENVQKRRDRSEAGKD